MKLSGKTKQNVRLQLRDVLYFTQYKFKLKSIDKVLGKQYSFLFENKKASFKFSKANECFPLQRKHLLVFFRTQFPYDKSVCHLVKVDASEFWRERLGQLGFTDVQNRIPTNLSCIENVCEICVMCKRTKVSVPKETEVKSTEPLKKIVY